MIPKIDAYAYYPYLGDFTHTYNGKSYYFDFTNVNDIPQDIQIDSSIFDSVIQAELSMDSMRIAQQGYIISSLSNYTADVASLIYNFALSSIDAIYQGLIDQEHSSLKWSVIYNGLVSPNRYSWTFSCPLGSQDIILGSDGLLPHASDHTYTSHNDTLISDILDDQVIGTDVYIPQGGYAFNQLNPPYFIGKSLYFTIYANNAPTVLKYNDFTNCLLIGEYDSAGNTFLPGIFDPKTNQIKENLVFASNNTMFTRSGSGPNTVYVTYDGLQQYGYIWRTWIFNNYDSFNLPFYSPSVSITNNANIGTYTLNNYSGKYQDSYIREDCPVIFLKKVSYNPVSNPDDIIIPQDEPMPVDPIITWPDDNLPDVDPDGDPVEVDPYEPEPIDPVIPLPPIPTVVSGNDDLWPDLNDYFETEDNIIDFTFPAVNVEFPDLSILLGNFVNSFTWVSTIITALFNGSDFSILFSVLAFFFIAAAVLGIYKWWK